MNLIKPFTSIFYLTFFTISQSIFAQKTTSLEINDSLLILHLDEMIYTASRVEKKLSTQQKQSLY